LGEKRRGKMKTLSDAHYRESKEDRDNRIFRARDRHQAKEDSADDDRDADFDREVNNEN